MNYDEKVVLKLNEDGIERTYKVARSEADSFRAMQILVWPEPLYIYHQKDGYAAWSYFSRPQTLEAIVDQVVADKKIQKALLYEHYDLDRWRVYSVERDDTDGKQKTVLKFMHELPRPLFMLTEESRLPKPFIFLAKNSVPIQFLLLLVAFILIFQLQMYQSNPHWGKQALIVALFLILLYPILLSLWEWGLEKRAQKLAYKIED